MWGGGFVSGKVIAQLAGPFTVSFLRFVMTSAVLGVIVRHQKTPVRLTRTLAAYIFAASFIGMVCYNYLFFSGIRLIDAGRGAVIISTVPVVVAVLSFVIFKERLSVINFLGIVLSLAGAWVVITRGEIGSFVAGGFGRGEIYLVLCVLCATTFTMTSKKALEVLSPLVVTLVIAIDGAAMMLVPAAIEVHQQGLITSGVFWGNLMYLALGPSVVAVIWYYEAIQTVGASRASQYMNLMPVFAVVLAMMFLHERITFSLLTGAALVCAGLYCTNVNPSKKKEPQAVYVE